MTRPLLYVAGPYSDPSETIRAWHTDRAALLGKLALACGYAPIVVHTSIAAGVYGDDSDADQRAAGMASTLAICAAVVADVGPVWALLRDDRTMSDGTAAEWAMMRGPADHQAMEWSEWRRRVKRKAPHLLTEWDRISVRPDAIMEWRAIADDYASRNYRCGRSAAAVARDGWYINTLDDGADLASGPETGADGRAAADAALRAAGLLP